MRQTDNRRNRSEKRFRPDVLAKFPNQHPSIRSANSEYMPRVDAEGLLYVLDKRTDKFDVVVLALSPRAGVGREVLILTGRIHVVLCDRRIANCCLRGFL